MSKLIDLSGQAFGLLTVLRRVDRDGTGKTRWEAVCACGKRIVVTALNLKTGNTKSCGCLKRRKGKDNPKYKPIPLDVKRERKRAGSQFKQWRASVLERCPVCIRCGEDKSLHAHHLLGSHEHPSLRFDPLNGVTLCASCHMQFHVEFGRKGGFSEADAEVFVASPIAWLVTRHKARNGLQDLLKARHYIDLLIELEGLEKDDFGQQNTLDYRTDEQKGFNDPRTVAGVDVSFPTEKHMSFAPECEHNFEDHGSYRFGSRGQQLTILNCGKCGAEQVEAEDE